MNMSDIEVKALKLEYCSNLLDELDSDSSPLDKDEIQLEEEFASGSTGIYLDKNVLEQLDISLGYREKGVNNCDIKNSILLFEGLYKLEDGKKCRITPMEASDRRIWTYLALSHFLPYMKKRWSTGDISKRYFMPGRREQLRFEYLVRHGVARLWWMAYLTFDPKSKDSFHLLNTLMASTDIATSILERKVSHDRKLLHAHLAAIESETDFQKEDVHRETIKKVLASTGTMEFGFLEKDEIQSFITDLAQSSTK